MTDLKGVANKKNCHSYYILVVHFTTFILFTLGTLGHIDKFCTKYTTSDITTTEMCGNNILLFLEVNYYLFEIE